MRVLLATSFMLICIVGVAARATRAACVIPADKDFVRSLDGQWRFKLEQRGEVQDKPQIGGQPRPVVLPKSFEPFQQSDYREDDSWKDIKVPGNWEMAGFGPATYNQPDNAIGLYRLSFDVPAEWKDREVLANFDGVQNGAEVYLNGKEVNVDESTDGKANFHQGGNTAFQVDLTPAVKFGAKNLLAIRVYKNTKQVDLDSGDFFFLGGIHRPVTLFSVPKTHLQDVKVETRLLPNDQAELKVIIAKGGPDATVGSATLEGATVAGNAVTDTPTGTVITQTLDHPRLWSAEHPNLYRLNVELKDGGGKTIESFARRVGVREVTIKDGIFLINNVPVKFTGICRHEVYPSLGTAINEKVWRKDITLMKSANLNAIRTSHYPYGSGFYDLCDELGMYVMDEMSAGWCDPSNKALAPAFAQHAREMVRRDKNHPCVVVWAVGNENKEGENNRIAAEEIHKLDATRPRLVSWRKGDEYGVELDDLHYTNPDRIAQLEAQTERRKVYPQIYLENPNDWDVRNGADYGCLDRWGAVIERTWREVWKDDHVPGSFLWEWSDRAVADPYPKKYYDFFPATGINLAKVKGQVDGFRNPRAGLYSVKMACAPIVVDLKPQVETDGVTVKVSNRFSFTDLSELKTTWHLLAGSKELKSADAAKLALAPRHAAEIKLDLPADVLAQADALQIDFAHADGGHIATYLLRLKPEAESAPHLDESLAGVNFPRLNLVPVTYKSNAIGWNTANRHPVKLKSITVQKSSGGSPEKVADESALLAMPLADVRSVDADLFESDAPNQIVGHVHVDHSAGKFSYKIDWTKPDVSKAAKRNTTKTDIQELGWAFAVPKSADHFSWHKLSMWSWYPPTHIGRPSGTALAETANVDVTKITRPDAFDFNSTKYDCDWATLADGSGKGIAASFAPDNRHHCRGNITASGDYELIVNRYCAPPRDISGGVVPDFYFELGQGSSASDSFMVGAVH